MDLTLTATIVLLGLGAGLTVLCGWMGMQPMNPRKGPRMVPWRFLMVLCFTFAVLMVVHLLNLVGVVTGQNQPRF